MAKEIIKTNLKLSDKVSLKYNDRDVDMSLSDFKTFLDANLEPTNAVLTADEPLRYKALLSQNAPITSTASETMLAGQVWELSGSANAADYAFFDTYELVSGTLYAIGSKYRVSVDTAFTFSASAIEYDGSPYIVSTDANGDLNPSINTITIPTTFEYGSATKYYVKSIGAFVTGKIYLYIGQAGTDVTDKAIIYDELDGDTLTIKTTSAGLLYYTPISIEVYP